ncbi:MAG: cytochrome c [Vicinamibacterales bacterium]|nr:cytochrome c [Vicinamibacterales bacterium]
MAAHPPVLCAQSGDRAGMTGEQLFKKACVACHGADGKGQPPEVRGFETEPPDFTDCHLTTPEADLDWDSIIHLGGRARSFDRIMPSFADELTDAEIGKIIGHLRTLCAERGWPRGDLNLPRAFVTEKAFPENEAVLTTTIAPSHEKSVSNEFLYEHRVGRRGQYEINVPLNFQQGDGGTWGAGVGDIAAAYKHVLFDSLASGSIVSAGGEIKFPTGSESKGLGGGVTVLEAFGTVSQMIGANGFLHVHTGFEVPSDTEKAPKEAFWRAAVGTSFLEHRFGRAWTPMVEVLGAREIVSGAASEWDVLPQMQVSLSTRQHVLVSAGVRVPLNDRADRGTSVLIYLLWDWFDGGLLSGW